MNPSAPPPLFSWTADVIVPVVLAVTIGSALSIYTGLIASRIFAFYQARAKTLSWWFDLHSAVTEFGDDPNDFIYEVMKRSYPLCIELRALGHEDAMATVVDIWDGLNKAARHVCGLDNPEDNVRLPTLTPAQVLAFKKIIGQHHNALLNTAAGRIGAMSPSVGALLSLRPFPNYITHRGQYIGLRIRRRDWWEPMMNYLRGATENWK